MPKSRLELLREIALYMGAQRVMLNDGGTRREILVDSLTARAVLRVHSLGFYQQPAGLQWPVADVWLNFDTPRRSDC